MPCSILSVCTASHQGWEHERKAGVPAAHDIQLHIPSALSLGQWPILLPVSQRVLDLSHFWVGPDNEDTSQGVMS